MRAIGSGLCAIGRNGPLLLVASLVLGTVSTSLADTGYRLLPFSAFLLTLGSFLTAALSPAEAQTRWSTMTAILLWLAVVMPIAGFGILHAVPLDPNLRVGIVLSICAPPVGSAAAIATMLGLQPRLALFTSIALTVVAPISIPLFARSFDVGVELDAAGPAWRLEFIVGAAAMLACASLHQRTRLADILPDHRAGAGVAVIGLIIVGLAMAKGVRAHWTSNPEVFLRLLIVAVAMNLVMCAVGTALFSTLGLTAATTVGLVSGNRNVTLAWAAAGFSLPSPSEAYLAACVVPVLALPFAVKLALSMRSMIARQIQAVR